jgi:hypothetical protein
METLTVIFAGVLAFAMSFGLAFGALDLLLSALAALRPALLTHPLPERTRKLKV